MQRKSAGYVKDFTYLFLCYGLILASNDLRDGSLDSDGADVPLCDYKANKRITRRLNTLCDKLKNNISTKCFEDDDLFKRYNKYKHDVYTCLIKNGGDSVVLEYLACYILYLRFQENERSKPLHEDFKWIVESDGQLFEIIDILNSQPIGQRDAEMYRVATIVANEL